MNTYGRDVEIIKLNENALPSGVVFNMQQKVVVEKLMNGLAYKSIAADLNISLQAVRQQAHRTYKKLNVANRMQVLIRYGLK